MSTTFTREDARARDRADALAGFRGRFHLPAGRARPSAIYLAGNSLGLQPRDVRALIDEELEDWARYGVAGHELSRRPWLPYHEQLANDTALIAGARAHEVVNMNTLTVNLHLMMVSFYRPTRARPCILIEAGAFPSDRYAVASQLAYHGLSAREALIEIAPRAGEEWVRAEDIDAVLERDGGRIALVLLPGVQYRTGQAFDLARITRLAHAQGCQVGFDVAHHIGNLPLQLHDWGPDFACWCSYKYLNAGPGAIAGCFVHERHGQSPELPRFAGWWGHDKATRFLMGPDFKVLPGAEGWQISNPPIFSMAPLIASLALFREAGMSRLRAKSLALTGYLESLLDAKLRSAIDIITPRDPAQRGCQLSLRLRAGAARGKAVFEAVSRRDAVCDWREPHTIRVAPVPLYNSFEDVWEFVEILADALNGAP
ncbi:MAG TPA: kynureninase [Steroidobacteraceae bacterium]|nr:kynureninase [Steroidobacteraceae bacterium]